MMDNLEQSTSDQPHSTPITLALRVTDIPQDPNVKVSPIPLKVIPRSLIHDIRACESYLDLSDVGSGSTLDEEEDPAPDESGPDEEEDPGDDEVGIGADPDDLSASGPDDVFCTDVDSAGEDIGPDQTRLRPSFVVPLFGRLQRQITDSQPSSRQKSDDDWRCQNPHCVTMETPSKVCHHGDCLDRNAGLPLILCTQCDSTVHSSPDTEGHLRFDLTTASNGVNSVPSNGRQRHSSSQSLPETSGFPDKSTSDTELEISHRDSGGDWVDGEEIRNTKLHRKKVLKVRRHNTEKETQPMHPALMTLMAARSHSYQEFSRVGLTGDQSDYRLQHGDSGVVMTTPGTMDTPDKKRVLSVDSLPSRLEPGYLYSNDRNMPAISPGFLSPQPDTSGRVSPQVFSDDDATATHRAKRDKRQHHNFGRKFSSPAMLSGSTHAAIVHTGDKLNLGAVENFTIHFDIVEDLIKAKDTEVVPAIKGVSLREAVGSYVEKRGLNFDMIDFFIASSQSALQVDTADCYFLAGADLHVKAKQSDSSFSRQILGSQKSTTSTSRANDKRPLYMYLKRDQSSASRGQYPGSPPGGSTPPTPPSAGPTHRWASLRQRNNIPNAVKNEPHPLAALQANQELSADDESKGSRSDLNVSDSSGSPHGTLKGPQPLKGIGKFFGVSTKKPDQLQELLASYKHHGWPPMPDLLQLGHTKFDPATFVLENSWTDLVKDTENCNRYQQEAIWELLKTEVAYIRDLELVLNLFLSCLYNLQSQALLNEVETEKIFSNISDLHQGNCQFYERHMLCVLTRARDTGQPLDPTPLIQGFSQFRAYFEPYSKFCIEYMGCQQYLSRMKEDNELFRMFLNWAENQRECNRLTLRDYIGKPFQRLTKYKLLLERIWKASVRPENVQDMISNVDQFICQVNATVTQLEIMRRIDSYDAVDLPNNDALAKMVGPFCRLDLTKPIPGSNRTRYLVEEGTLRMNNRTDVVCFLFTDMLLVTKTTSRKADTNNKPKVKVYKPPMRLDKVYVSALADGGFMLVSLNEYNLATAAYTFHGDHARSWLDSLRHTQDEYQRLRNTLMDQSEAYLLNLAHGYEQYTDDHAYLNARHVAMETGLDRQGSQSSADTFLRSRPETDARTPTVTPGATNCRFQSPEEEDSGPWSRSAGRARGALPPLDKKVKARRDRRYYTADMIQDMHQKDASIQKRLSWHSGNKDSDYGGPGGLGGGRLDSSDSLRGSVHSSSGVSSVGSLHVSPDISEEPAAEQGDEDWAAELSSDDNDPVTPPTDANHNVDTTNLATAAKVSKSMPDMSRLSIVDEGGDSEPDTPTRDLAGGSTVDLIREGQQQRRKLSHTQNKKLRLHILNSTLEATDV